MLRQVAAVESERSSKAGRLGRATLWRMQDRVGKTNWPFWVVFAFVLLLWEIAAHWVVRNALIIVPLEEIAKRGVELWSSGQLSRDIAVSGIEVLGGFWLAAVVGTMVGIVSGNWKAVGRVVDPFVSATYAMPIIALAPLFIITLGLGMASKIAVVALASFFPITFTTAAGVRATEAAYRELGRAFSLPPIAILWKIVIPSSIPYILAGFRVAVGRALTVVIAAELFGARDGLGLRILTSSAQFDVAGVYVGVAIFSLAGVVFTKAFYSLERRVAPWRGTQ